jgi:hypothetical protein
MDIEFFADTRRTAAARMTPAISPAAPTARPFGDAGSMRAAR